MARAGRGCHMTALYDSMSAPEPEFPDALQWVPERHSICQSKHKSNTLNRGCCLNNLREAETVFKSHQQLHKDHENSSSVDANRASEIRTPSSSELLLSGPYGSGSAEHTSTVVTGKHSPMLASDMHVIRSLTHTRAHMHICTHRNSEHRYTQGFGSWGPHCPREYTHFLGTAKWQRRSQ